MYTVQWAENFEGFSKEDPIDIHLFTQFYTEHIASKHFVYTTNHKRVPTFTIESAGTQLPHLMGLQHWNNLPTTQAARQYELMRDGDWDLDMLIAADDGAWKTYRERIEFTPHLYNLLHKCECSVKLVNPSAYGSGFHRRRIDMFFQHEKGKLIFALELRKVEGDLYRPVSLTTHRKGSQTMREHHIPIKITNVEIRDITEKEKAAE